MNENMDNQVYVSEYEPHGALLGKWLKFLFIVHIISLARTPLGLVPLLSQVAVVAGWVVSACVIVAMFQLAPAHARYRKAAICLCVSLGSTLVSRLLGVEGMMASFLDLAGSVSSLIALYQEYSAHSDVVAQADPKLSRKWHSLFNWQIIIGAVSYVGILLLTGMLLSADSLVTILASVILLGFSVVGIVLEVLYLVYLNRTRNCFREN